MNYNHKNKKQHNDKQSQQHPLPIIQCSDKDGAEVEYATTGISNKLFVSRYLTALPSVEKLQKFLIADRARTEALMEQAKPQGRAPARRGRHRRS
jgi:hypothetical protein